MKSLYKAYTIELDPNNKQVILLKKSCGVARFAYNWALDKVNKKELKPSLTALSKEINQIKDEQFPWVREVSKWCLQSTFKDLQKSFLNFFNKKSKYPKFKKKADKQSFTVWSDIKTKPDKIHIPKIGWIRLKESNYIPLDKKIISATCFYRAGRWFVSVIVKEELISKVVSGVIGVDLGINKLAVLSDGTIFENPKALRSYKAQLRKQQKRLSRQKKGSKRRETTKNKLAKLYYRIANIRKDAIHKATSWITKTKFPETVVLENLSVKNMMKNHKLAGAISDCSFYEFRRQIEYKQAWNGGKVVIADRFYPSSKTCSKCGNVKPDLKQSDRTYKCNCGLELDRDLNAAKNLMSLGLRANAHGEVTVVKQPLRSENLTVQVS